MQRLAASRGSFSTIRLVLGRRRLPQTVAHLGERLSHPYYADHQTPPRRHWFPRPAPHLGGREKFRVDQQAPPLRARPRNQTRPPRSHGPPRHDHDRDQTTRPNLTVFKHPLRDAQTDPCLVSRETGVIRSCLNRRSRTSPSAATLGNKHCVQNSAPPGPLGGLPEGHVESIDGSDQQAKGIMCDVR